MDKLRPTERADIAYEDLTAAEVREVYDAFAGTFSQGWERRMFFTHWTDGHWSASATRPLWVKASKEST